MTFTSFNCSRHIETPSKVEFMLLPRLLSLSEIAWTKLSNKDFKNFSEERAPLHLARLDKTSTNYWVPTAIGQPDKMQTGESFTVELKVPITGAKIFYTLDNYRPSENATEYTSAIKINVPQGQRKILKTIVIAPSGRRSVVVETVFNNGAVEVKTK
ncbi:MAG: hypothetical protein EOO07_25755 [Chitinophagaceae bacterium]|nr:MAG: hypothetical protein EOO07_25755 [Chitinophagaceae bacterium]